MPAQAAHLTELTSLPALLAETVRLRDRFQATQPDSQRLPILIKDAARLQALIAKQEG